MKKLLTLVLALTSGFCLADDTFVELGIGGVSLPSQAKVGENLISIESEKISLLLHYAFYEVTVDFRMLNPGGERTYSVGFPVKSTSSGSGVTRDAYKATAIVGFNTSVDGEPVRFTYQPSSQNEGISAWYVKDVTFKANGYTDIQIRYVSEYGSSGGNQLCDYYFGTGRFWNGPIHSLVVRVENATEDESVYVLKMVPTPASKRAVVFPAANAVELSYSDIKPDQEGKFEVSVFPFYGEDFYEGSFDYKMEPSQFTYYTKNQLRIMRNAFFAKHGMIFSSDDLNSLFNQRYLIQQAGWYKPKLKNVDSLLTALDRENISTIQEMERIRESKSLHLQELVAGSRSEAYRFVVR